MIAPTIPPMIAPQLARREPPYLRVYFAVSVNSMTSPTSAITATSTVVKMLIEFGTSSE